MKINIPIALSLLLTVSAASAEPITVSKQWFCDNANTLTFITGTANSMIDYNGEPFVISSAEYINGGVRFHGSGADKNIALLVKQNMTMVILARQSALDNPWSHTCLQNLSSEQMKFTTEGWKQ